MELNYVISITDRAETQELASLFQSLELNMGLVMLGKGTATSEQLSIYGLSNTEKAIVSTVADSESTKQLFRAAKRKLFMDIPGNGIMLTIPIKSVAGGRTLAYLTGNKTPSGSAPDMHFEHELIIAVLNAGYSDAVMDAARTAGAGGGTVLHARGTGTKQAEKFFGVSLAEEKDILYIVAASRCRSPTSSACARSRTEPAPSSPFRLSQTDLKQGPVLLQRIGTRRGLVIFARL